jgi:hypothetical protein
MLVQRTVDAFLHGFAHEAGAVLFLEQAERHLALAKALHGDLGLSFLELFHDLGLQFGGRQMDRVAALEAVIEGLGDLHSCFLFNVSWCG